MRAEPSFDPSHLAAYAEARAILAAERRERRAIASHLRLALPESD